MKKWIMILMMVLCFRGVVLAGDGITQPIGIDPVVELTNGKIVFYTYRLLLNRDPDAVEMRLYVKYLETRGATKTLQFWTQIKDGGEFKAQSINKTEYIKRLYRELLGREASADDVAFWLPNVKELSEVGGIDSWMAAFDSFVGSAEYKTKTCKTSYYSYGQALKNTAPTLNDLFVGKARFQTLTESQALNITFTSPGAYSWDMKVPMFWDAVKGTYFAFTRALTKTNPDDWNVYLMKSTDGVNFTEVEKVFTGDYSGMNFYDPHLSVDYSVCPERYVMTMECGGGLCVSVSSTPSMAASWSTPKMMVKRDKDSHLTASTGVMMIDGSKKYLYWTAIDDPNVEQDKGDESAWIRGVEISKVGQYLGKTEEVGEVIVPAEKNIYCTSPWDCDNRDKQDVKKEGSYYYMMYNGANYYRCIRPGADMNNYSNDWGLGILRSQSPLSGYNLPGSGKIIDSENKKVCGISYPVFNEVNGELYMYYAYVKADWGHGTMRSKLVWINEPTGSPGIVPNCSNLTGPTKINLGTKATFSANFSSPQGNLTGEILYGNFKSIKKQSLAGNGTMTVEWTPTQAGKYDIFCRAWNDGVAECRPPEFVDSPPRYPCSGPGYKLQVEVVVPTTTPVVACLSFSCGSSNPTRDKGNANCDSKINILDFAVWKKEYLEYKTNNILKNNFQSDFNCDKKVTITDFGIWKKGYLGK